MNKKILMFGILAILGVGLASAAILTYFGMITTTVNVGQAVTLNGENCNAGVCSETIPIGETQGGETVTSEVYELKSHTSVDGVVLLEMGCSSDTEEDSCDEIISKPVFELSIPSQTAPNLVQDRVVAKSGAIEVEDIDTLSFDYKLTTTTLGNSPYFVLVFDKNGDGEADTWAVSLQDSGKSADTWYTHGNGLLYHNVGACTQSSPCDLAGLKAAVGTGTLLQVKVMIGYWGDMTATTALVKDIVINGGDVTGNGLVIRHYDMTDPEDYEYGESRVNFAIETEFPFASIPATYTITTEVQPVA